MPLAELVTAFERDTETEVLAILAAGIAEAARIDAAATRARSERIAGASGTFAAGRRIDADARIAEASRRARIAVLATRAAMLDRVRAAVRAQLPALVDTRLGTNLIAAAVACVGDEPGTLRCRPGLVEVARRLAPASVQVEADAEVATGAIIDVATGTRIEATLDAFLDREWPRLACEVLAMERAR